MNLSERLDAARRQRQNGLAPDLHEEAYLLRSTVEGQRYDGTDVRSGEAMDADRWEAVRAERTGMALPSLSEPDPPPDPASTPSLVDGARLFEPLLDLTGVDPVVAPEGERLRGPLPWRSPGAEAPSALEP
jgi:hypothetical protein